MRSWFRSALPWGARVGTDMRYARRRGLLRSRLWLAFLALIGLLLSGLALLSYKRDALVWRMEQVRAAILDWQVGGTDTDRVPTPMVETVSRGEVAFPEITLGEATAERRGAPATTPDTSIAFSPALAPLPIPRSTTLTGMRYQRQTINNCGPATLAMMLSCPYSAHRRHGCINFRPLAVFSTSSTR